MNNEAKEIELELQPLSTDMRQSSGFDEPGAAGFSLLPAQQSKQQYDAELSLVNIEQFSFR